MRESISTATATFRINPELKARVDNLARKTNRSSSYFYNQLVSNHIDELEEIYECLSIVEDVKRGKEKTVPLEKILSDYGL